MKLIKTFFTLLVMFMTVTSAFAKTCKWKGLDHDLQVVQIAQGQKQCIICKAWGFAGSPDKAIDQALQDAIVQVIFYGLDKGKAQSSHEAILKQGAAAYDANKTYFDDFFKKGEYLNYIRNINNNYPTGENNLSVPGGRRLAINVEIDLVGLEDRLKNDGLQTSTDLGVDRFK